MEAVLDAAYTPREPDEALGFVRMQNTVYAILSEQIKHLQPSPYSDSFDTPETRDKQLLSSSDTTEPPPEHLLQHMQHSD
jgi:hypothetical protein